MKKIVLPLLYFLFLSIPILGQEGQREILAVKSDGSIVIDGLLDESIWENAPDAYTFIQPRPDRTDPNKIKTTVKILYDDNFVYFGFLCYDIEPDKIVPGAITIDGDLRDTDSIYILIDTLSGLRNFFYFGTNYIGTKSDGIISIGGRSVNYSWNGSWESFSQKTDFGWSSEVAIELSSIFPGPVENKTIGLSFARMVPRLEISIFQPNPLDSAFRPYELGNLKTLDLFDVEAKIEAERRAAELLEPGKKARITPYAFAKLEADGTFKAAAGIEALYAFSQQMSGKLAIYPDFETVEPDHELVNLTPFELYLPERRSFFQETSDIYQQPFSLFYSKRIGDIYGGVKLSGKYEATEFSLVSAQTKNDEDLNVDSANFSVLSFKKKNILNFFTIGLTAANKNIGGENMGAAGIEASLDFSDKFKFSGQFALSYGDYGNNNTAFYIGPSYDSRTFHFHFHYKQIDKYFGDNANYVGFIPDDNRRELDSAINKTFSFRRGIFERIAYRSNYNIYWGMDSTLRSWQIDEGFYFYTKKKFTVSVTHTMEYKLNEFMLEPDLLYDPSRRGWVKLFTRDFRNNQTRFTSSYYSNEWMQFSLFISGGKNYGSKFHMFGISKKIEIAKGLFSEYDFYRIRYLEESLHPATYVHVVRLTLKMSEKLSWKIFYQSNTGIEKSNIQVVGTYLFKPPFGTLQVIYQKGSPEFGVMGTEGQIFFLKLGYVF